MKRISFFIILSFLTISCNTELVKWEFVSTPVVSELGPFTNSTISIEKTITKNEIITKIGLDNTSELRELRIKEASIDILIKEDVIQAESLEYELYCDAIPFKPTHKGIIKIKPGTLSKDLGKEKIKLGPVSLEAISFVNIALNGIISNNKTIQFEFIARALPSGFTVTGFVDVYISFDAIYWKCVERPEISVLSDSNKGLCN